MVNYDPHRWLDHFFDIRGSMLREILGRVAACVAWSALVVLAYRRGYHVAIPSTLHALVGTALGLLLVFRTNASYDRFWEGRKLWGGMVNECRNLIRGGSAHLAGDLALLARLTRWTAAFPFACMNVLRGVKGLGDAVKYLPTDKGEQVAASAHPALAIAQEMTACLLEARQSGLISEYILVALDQNIQLLVDYLGGCERIRKTPLPFAYVVHLRRALVAYCFTLPFALVETFGWATSLDVLLVSYVFFGIEEIGVEIEGPFGFDDNDLPLEQICDTIQRNVAQIAGLRLDSAQAKEEDWGSL
jgi:putative membrane protein